MVDGNKDNQKIGLRDCMANANIDKGTFNVEETWEWLKRGCYIGILMTLILRPNYTII